MANSFILLSATTLVLLFLVTAHGFEIHDKDVESEDSLWNLYERWRTHHTVSRSLHEKHKRFNVFKENVRHINSVNKLDRPYKLKLNRFGDLTRHEFRTRYAASRINHHRMLSGRHHNNSTNTFMYAHVDVAALPASVDWRTKGAVTPENDEDALLKAVANQPVSAAIDASDLQFYSEGVYSGDCGKDLDHGIAIVGYGTTVDGTKYWTVKNSWGPEWGEKGYFRLHRGVSDKEGMCGIAMQPSYPVKSSSSNPTGPGDHVKDEL